MNLLDRSGNAEIQFNQSAKFAGIILLVCTGILVFLMAHHPSHSAHDFDGFVGEVKSGRVFNGIVHGGAITIVLVFLFSLSYLTTYLGSHRALIRLGTIFYVAGAIGMCCAAYVSGFIVPGFVERFESPSSSEIEIASQILSALRTVNQNASNGGVVGMSLGILFWSLSMLFRQNRCLFGGGLGTVVGAFGVIGLFSGHTTADLHGVLIFAALQAAWYIYVGVGLIRGRFTSAEAKS